MNYCYILECGDGSLYTGWTNNIVKRYQAHCEGKGAKYTKGRGPFTIVFLETFATKEDAMSREYEIKHLTKAQKQKLITSCAKQSEVFINSAFIEKILDE